MMKITVVLKAIALVSVAGLLLVWMYLDIFVGNQCICKQEIDDRLVERVIAEITRNRTKYKGRAQRITAVDNIEESGTESGTTITALETEHYRDILARKEAGHELLVSKQHLEKQKSKTATVEEVNDEKTLVKELGPLSSDTRNLTIPVAGNVTKCQEMISRPNELYIITMLSVFNGNVWSGYDKFSTGDLKERDKEYLRTLETNINHKLVKQVHLFYIEDGALKLVKAQHFKNEHKIVPVKTRRKLHMADFFMYASRNLVDKTVVAMNGDIILGDGYDKIDTERMRDEKVLYSLSRYNVVDPEKKCVPSNMALSSYYEASHDTHIFRLAEPLDEGILMDYLDLPINLWGADNAMVWVFRFMLKYNVRNPCVILSTYHNHCVKVHGPGQDEINKNKYSIYFLPNRKWKVKHVLDSFALFEDCLNYGGLEDNMEPDQIPS